MDLDALLLHQAGVVSLHQAVAAGMSGAHGAAPASRPGPWRELHPGSYLAGGHRLTAEARIRAAALWCGDHATVSGAAAAFWQGMLPRFPAQWTSPCRGTFADHRPAACCPTGAISTRRIGSRCAGCG